MKGLFALLATTVLVSGTYAYAQDSSTTATETEQTQSESVTPTPPPVQNNSSSESNSYSSKTVKKLVKAPVQEKKTTFTRKVAYRPRPAVHRHICSRTTSCSTKPAASEQVIEKSEHFSHNDSSNSSHSSDNE